MHRVVETQVQNRDLVGERREQIIRAAIVVFRRKGFHESTTRDLAEEAGVTQSNIYNYVKSKGDILYLVCSHLVDIYLTCLDEVVEKHSDPHVRLVKAVESIISLMSEHKDELILLYNETHSLNGNDRILVLQTVERFTKQFQGLLDAYAAGGGSLRIKNRRLAANFLSFVPAIVALRGWDISKHTKKEEAEEGILTFILGGLGVLLPEENA